MNDLQIMSIFWILQNILFVVLIFHIRSEYEAKLTYHRIFLLLLAEKTGISLDEVNRKVEQRQEWLHSQSK